jgi:uncharacterized protein YacL
MVFFQDISHFSNMHDYLPILNGVLFVEIIVLFLALSQKKPSSLQTWYKTYRLSAVIADVLIVVLGIIIARFLYPFIFDTFSIWKFILLLVCLQTIHDILFYGFFTLIPRGKNQMLDLFKDYAKSVGGSAILGDNLIVIFSALFASILAKYTTNTNIIATCIAVYFIPYFLYIQ